MRDAGLDKAIKAAGGISALARGLGVAQPSVSNWTRVPADRVVAVETLTSVPRADLRPDLFSKPEHGAGGQDTVDAMRGTLYLLLSNLLLRVPQDATLAELARMPVDGEGVVADALRTLAEAAKVTSGPEAAREHFDLFVGVGRGEILPYASYYLTGFLYERPLVRIRQDLTVLGLARDSGHAEPEDSIGFLCEVMASLASGRVDAEPGAERRFFERHVSPWAERVFADVEKAQSARFYRAVGQLGRVFIAIEREAFALDVPNPSAGLNDPDGLQEESHERKAS